MASALSRSAASAPVPAAATLGRVGDYDLIGVLGEGGQGVVYRARQRSLNRIVALKLLRGGALAGGADAARFRAEATAAAALRHPGLVAVYDVGEHAGQLYYSMEQIEGTDLARLTQEERVEPEWAARCVARVAEAVQAAHEHGVLHRDLKPSNVLLDGDDTPRVTDFGLARRLDQAGRLTLSQQALGTPGYAAPELVGGPQVTATPATDVYGLGVILYHLLTGRPPFVGDSLPEVLRQVVEQEPVAPRILRPGIPRDIETVCLKCLRKEPVRRYRSAQAVADDLNRFLRGEPVQARPIGAVERGWRWCRRRPGVAALTIGLAGALIALAVGSTLAAFRINQARLDERQQHALAERALDAYHAIVAAPDRNGQAGQQFGALEAIARAVEFGSLTPQLERDLRRRAIRALAGLDLRPVWTKRLRMREEFATVDRPLERYVVVGTNGTISLHPVGNDRELARFTQPTNGAVWRPYYFSNDGRLLAVSSGVSGRTRVWDLPNRQLALELPGEPLGFTADAGQIVVRTPSAAGLAIQDLAQPARRIELLPGTRCEVAALDPAGRSLAAVHAAGPGAVPEIIIVDAVSGRERNRFVVEGKQVHCAWHPGGRYLAVTGDGLQNAIHCYDAATGRRTTALSGHGHFVPCLAFNADGSLLASSSWDNTTRLWSFPDGRELLRIQSSGFPAFARDGRRFSLVGWDQEALLLFELAPPPLEARRFEMSVDPQESAEYAAFNSSGRVLAHSEGGRNLTLRDAATLEALIVLTNHAIGGLARDPLSDGFLLGSGRCLRLPLTVDAASDTIRIGPLTPWGPTNHFGPAARSADGRLMAGVGGAGEVQAFDLANPGSFRRLGSHPEAHCLALSPDGRWAATGAWNRPGVRVWDVARGRLDRDLPTESMATVAFSPDGRWLVVSSGNFVFWKVGSWETGFAIRRPPLETFPSPIAYTRDGTMLALCPDSRSVRLVNPDTGAEYATLELPDPWWISGLDFSPDGSQLVMSGFWTREFCVWDLRRIRQRLAALRLDWDRPPYPPPQSRPPLRVD